MPNSMLHKRIADALSAVPKDALENRFLLVNFTRAPTIKAALEAAGIGIIDDCSDCIREADDPICLTTALPSNLAETQNPILYVVESITDLWTANALWWSRRPNPSHDIVLRLGS